MIIILIYYSLLISFFTFRIKFTNFIRMSFTFTLFQHFWRNSLNCLTYREVRTSINKFSFIISFGRFWVFILFRLMHFLFHHYGIFLHFLEIRIFLNRLNILLILYYTIFCSHNRNKILRNCNSLLKGRKIVSIKKLNTFII